MPKCQTCHHPDRERIDSELALSSSVREVSERWDIPRRSLARHRQQCMTQDQIARIRFDVPAQVEVDIAELTRRGGEDAMLGLKRMRPQLTGIAEKCEAIGMYGEAAKYRKLELECYREQLKIAALYPGKKTVTNNHLVITDGQPMFELFDRILTVAEDITAARRMLAAEFRMLAAPEATA
ncbi:MAG: hypothetical protein MK141_01855 [Pseudoxanthomonas sp.]|uniref:hypothetical protein n=1 Tax=Pseudoxanthomonas sp. TaxID=1871049 RepID=UPI002589D07B|nr:hypothetical protein [Pseudoxanthomonas sp.]MCH2090310.1 hypothetical protein [Pseudoxanthomonas sp.]